ncbi:hypothetical protein [Streptomyces sp. NPDC046925]|uniref:hypothetical protein n=1 Tax=Streptomyces sp. NPDC046925 TaxID=3155375 RepID=UPI0033F6246B
MNAAEIITALCASTLGSVVGAMIAFYSHRHASRQLALANDQEQRRAENAALNAAVSEMDVVEEIAKEAAATDLPTQMLTTVLPTIHHMHSDQQMAVVVYSQKVLRYNGRVRRLIAYGAAKRTFKNPGVEKPREHADEVLRVVTNARKALTDHMESARYVHEQRTDEGRLHRLGS